MNGYIYTLYAGADPGNGWIMNDPIFGKTPALGSCVPNIRRAVELGDWIFAISGRVPGLQQYVVGGFQVKEKINQLAAFDRFPDFRFQKAKDGTVTGNIIVQADGTQHPDDDHSNFERRLDNFLVGGDSLTVESPQEIECARTQSLPFLNRLFEKQGNRIFDVIGRHRKMNSDQVAEMREWLASLKQ